MTTDYARGWREAIEAAAKRVESRDEERQALARVIRSLSPPPERGDAAAATCGGCGKPIGSWYVTDDGKRCPDCAPASVATARAGTDGDCTCPPGTTCANRPPADAKAATCASPLGHDFATNGECIYCDATEEQ